MQQDRFEIIRIIGKGRTGGVYEAHDTLANHKVALRRFFSVDGDTDTGLWEEEFISLVANLAEVRHPSLVTIYEAGVDQDGAYMTMELLEDGRRLEEVVAKSGKLSNDDFRLMANDLLGAFSRMHHQGYCHGSISASSVMEVTLENGSKVYKIVDLGMSLMIPLINPQISLLQAASPSVIAPELSDGETADSRSDVYMLGHLFYLSLAGGHPLAGESKESAYEKHKDHTFASLSKYSDVSSEVVDWIDHMTQANPNDRPQTASEALELMPKFDHSVKKAEVTMVPAKQIGSEKRNESTDRLSSLLATKVAPSSSWRFKGWLVYGVAFIALGLLAIFFLRDDTKNTVKLEISEPDQEEKGEVQLPLTDIPKQDLPQIVIPDPEKPEVVVISDEISTSRGVFYKSVLLSEYHKTINADKLKKHVAFENALGWSILGDFGEDTGFLTRSEIVSNKGYKLEILEEPTLQTYIESVWGLFYDKSEPVSPLAVKYWMNGFEGDLKSRLYLRVNNVSVKANIAGIEVLPDAEEGKSYSGMRGLYFIDVEINGIEKSDDFCVEFKINRKSKGGEEAEFSPFVFVLYDEFPKNTDVNLEDDERIPYDDTLENETYPGGVKITENENGIRTLELIPIEGN